MSHVTCAFSTFGVQIVIPNGCWSMTAITSKKPSAWKGHPHKMFRFPSPDRPIFFGKEKKKKKKIRITCKEASTLVYKHTILSY